MGEEKKYLQKLFASRGITIPGGRQPMFDNFTKDNAAIIAQIISNQQMLMKNWALDTKIKDILEGFLFLPNGTVGRPYLHHLNLEQDCFSAITNYEIAGLENFGLAFDADGKAISGIPTNSGDWKIVFKFKIDGEPEEAALNEKLLTIIVNPDPKSLWKNIPSDTTDTYWKPDAATGFERLGDKFIVVSSKRGRSHATNGTFRDDHFAFLSLPNFGWSIVALADGAGSARLARYGSKLACEAVTDFFATNSDDVLGRLDTSVKIYYEAKDVDTKRTLDQAVYTVLGNAALSAFTMLDQTSKTIEAPLKDFNTTLIFTLFKKFDFGYVLLSFSVGDCPIALLTKNFSAVTQLNQLDVGEFSGGTRFLANDLFHKENLPSRFRFQIIEDFGYLVMMSDGIYDPKFEVEANLGKMEKWKAFFDDLNGENSDGSRVLIDANNPNIKDQLSDWMDFWSPGNHDDRTLAIIF